MKRPHKLKGATSRHEMCGTLFITLNEDDKGRPYELFAFGSKLGTCRSNLEGLARCISKLLQGNDLEGAIDALELIRCPAMERKKGEARVTKERNLDEIPCSCADAMARELKEYLKK
uniref:ribonucleoside-diphosphate reductase n=1 Tax=viral metagenome TaxID=1070528 RepID=A0A6M3LIY3_9ZZZZ